MKLNLFFILILLILSSTIIGAGYEKVVQWGAVESSKSGAVSSTTQGANALFFNPAGLAKGIKGFSEFTINLSPTMTKSSGPVFKDLQKIKGDKQFKFPFGLLGNYKYNNKLGFGVGLYSIAGTGSEYKDGSNYTSINSQFDTLNAKTSSSLSVIEIAIGAGYQVNKNLSIGASLRADYIQAEFSNSKVTYLSDETPLSLSSTTIEDLTKFKFAGAKLGAQYLANNKKWGLGLTFRTQTPFTIKGKNSGNIVYTDAGRGALLSGGMPISQLPTAGENYTLTGSDNATATTILPSQISFGGHYRVYPKLTIFYEYTWSNYSSCRELEIDATLKNSNILFDKKTPSVTQNWENMSNYRFAIEELRYPWAIRAGYSLTSQVTNTNASSPTFSAPSRAHSITFGTGKSFLKYKLTFDTMLEYSFSKDNGRTADRSTNSTLLSPPIQGEFDTSAYAIYFSLSYKQ